MDEQNSDFEWTDIFEVIMGYWGLLILLSPLLLAFLIAILIWLLVR